MSGILVAKASQNYQAATQRPACRNCQHGAEVKEGPRTGWKCCLGGFFVTPYSVCAKHARKPGTRDA